MQEALEYDFININTGVTYYHLSDGEREILNICVDLIHHISLHSHKNQLILSDEIDNSLHPKWKKEIFSIIIKIFNQFKEIYRETNIHFITTTHSPFILSDIPKDNVVFLKDGKQVDVNVDTFGANIHTLLSHGFFMSDGLMGEFAKEKINQIINYLNDKESEITNNETAQNFINIIGEPILKRQLQKMLDSKRISRMDEIDELKKRIELLESKQ